MCRLWGKTTKVNIRSWNWWFDSRLLWSYVKASLGKTLNPHLERSVGQQLVISVGCVSEWVDVRRSKASR